MLEGTLRTARSGTFWLNLEFTSHHHVHAPVLTARRQRRDLMASPHLFDETCLLRGSGLAFSLNSEGSMRWNVFLSISGRCLVLREFVGKVLPLEQQNANHASRFGE